MNNFLSSHSHMLITLFLLHSATFITSEEGRSVYIVTLKSPPISHHDSSLSRNSKIKDEIHQLHDSLLAGTLLFGSYRKLYSYHYLVNGFTVLITHQQAGELSKKEEIASVVLDSVVRTATTRTPQFLGLPGGAWSKVGGHGNAGEGVVIGFVDTGIDPMHPSFADDGFVYPTPKRFSGFCEVSRDFPAGFCNRKVIGARHFAASATTRGVLNATNDIASPIDGDGHGTHTAAVAAGNFGVPVVVAGRLYGNCSGMAPRAQISVYKALYKHFGGFLSDIVAAIDQAAQDGVDIINLSITPNNRPPGIATFFNPLDLALLSAIKAGIFVVQAAGNTGPGPKTMSSFAPWIFTVGATSHDRVYSNSITLGNNLTVSGVGLAPGTDEGTFFSMISALDALNETTSSNIMYLDECQDPQYYVKELVENRLLMCKYSVRYVLGVSSINQAVKTAADLSSAGIIFLIDSIMYGFKINPTPLSIPGIIISNPENSKIIMEYYKDSSEKVASVSGLKTSFVESSPSVMYYSARGPDPEDASLENADFLKPNVVAPGNMIWGAWSSLASDSIEFQGEKFSLLSGTSMAAPHVAGLAALVKQMFPTFSPAAISSALSTTASSIDKEGAPILAERFSLELEDRKSPASPFDMGCGFVNTTGALDPGLIFDAGFEDFMSFLCGFTGSSGVIYNRTGENCGRYGGPIAGGELNLPSITIARLEDRRTVRRKVKNVGGKETYRAVVKSPEGVSVEVRPALFSVDSGTSQVFNVTLIATRNSTLPTFGNIHLLGHLGHFLNIPLSVIIKTSTIS